MSAARKTTVSNIASFYKEAGITAHPDAALQRQYDYDNCLAAEGNLSAVNAMRAEMKGAAANKSHEDAKDSKHVKHESKASTPSRAPAQQALVDNATDTLAKNELSVAHILNDRNVIRLTAMLYANNIEDKATIISIMKMLNEAKILNTESFNRLYENRDDLNRIFLALTCFKENRSLTATTFKCLITNLPHLPSVLAEEHYDAMVVKANEVDRTHTGFLNNLFRREPDASSLKLTDTTSPDVRKSFKHS